jgi:transcriptional regulator with XRE-family HTH domain
MAKSLWGRRYRALLPVLIDIRRQAGLTQRDLSKRLKWVPSKVAKVEIGEQQVNPADCVEWAQACGKDPFELFVRYLRALGL